MAKLTRMKMTLPLLALTALLILSLPIVHAGVGLEYLGPNPLTPQPVFGQANTLQAAAIVGNSGNETAIISFMLQADQEFMSHFTYSFSENNFSLSPGARSDFTLTLTFDSNTPAQDYSATVNIVASPASRSGTIGSAGFNLPVLVSSTVVPEFPNGAALTLLLALLALPIVRRTIKSKRTIKKRAELD